MKRWSTKDPESAPGSPYDSEKPDSARKSFLQLGVVQSAVSLSRSFRREMVVEAGAAGVTVRRPGNARVIPWTEVTSIQTNLAYPRPTDAPAIAIVLRNGEVVGLPDALYPDAATNFPSHRHTERARDIATELTDLWTESSSGTQA